LEEPGVLHSPEGHAVQLLAAASLYVPAGQIAQPDTLSRKVPAEPHLMQAEAP